MIERLAQSLSAWAFRAEGPKFYPAGGIFFYFYFLFFISHASFSKLIYLINRHFIQLGQLG